jgi:hypothetical protein
MSHTDTLDDFEQSLHQFTITVEENIEALLGILDREDVPAPVADKLMNILIGMSGYVDARSTDLCEDLEHHIKKQIGPGHKWRGYLKVEDGGVITLPICVVKHLGWEPGDILEWSLLNDGAVQLKKFPMQQS